MCGLGISEPETPIWRTDGLVLDRLVNVLS